jgi:hypothetical protein
MAIFISYSHKNKELAQKLALNLVRRRIPVWIDDWEVSCGESLIEAVQKAVQDSSALLILLSKDSVESVWCKTEVVAAIQRELEEKKILAIPVLLEDCDIPLFLRVKKYADFRKNFDEGLRAVLEAVAKITNTTMGSVSTDDYHTDWVYQWISNEDFIGVEFLMFQHSSQWGHSIFTRIVIACHIAELVERYMRLVHAGIDDVPCVELLEIILDSLRNKEDQFNLFLQDNHPHIHDFEILNSKLEIGFSVHMEGRRLGNDNGKDILVHGFKEFEKIRSIIIDRMNK